MSLVDEFRRTVAEKLDDMNKTGIEWAPERQAEYNAACLEFYKASLAKDQHRMETSLATVRRLEAEGGIL